MDENEQDTIEGIEEEAPENEEEREFSPSLSERAEAASERAGASAYRLLGRAESKAEPVLEGIGSKLEESVQQPDDLSDLFERPDAHDNDMETDDLVSLDEEDVFGDGGSDMSDILEVDEEDIMGDEDFIGEDREQTVKRPAQSARRPQRVVPSTGISGVQV